jgi:ADP-ribose pyrophosphatase YjhB (NUDIX family)
MKRVFTQTFGVVGAIIERNGKILLVKEAKKEADIGKWNHPAGWIEVGEDPIEAVKREVKEETGLEFTPTHILGIYSLARKNLKPIHHPIKIIFIGNISDKETKELSEDVSENKWFTPVEIEKMDSNTLRDLDIKKMVKDYFSGKKYPLDIITHTVVESKRF